MWPPDIRKVEHCVSRKSKIAAIEFQQSQMLWLGDELTVVYCGYQFKESETSLQPVVTYCLTAFLAIDN